MGYPGASCQLVKNYLEANALVYISDRCVGGEDLAALRERMKVRIERLVMRSLRCVGVLLWVLSPCNSGCYGGYIPPILSLDHRSGWTDTLLSTRVLRHLSLPASTGSCINPKCLNQTEEKPHR